jgi:transposase-like protein
MIMRMIVAVGMIMMSARATRMVRTLGVMIVRVLRRRRRFGFECVQSTKERAPLHPKKPGTDQDD